MATLAGFDASQQGEMQNFEAIPAAPYVMMITESEMKPTKDNTGQYLQLVSEVLDGPYKGRKLWIRLNLVNKNQTAVDIAKRELAAVCKAVGIITPQDSAELHNRPFIATVTVKAGREGKQENSITKYEPVSGIPAPAQHFQTGPAPAPVYAAPAQGFAAPQAAPAAWTPPVGPAAAPYVPPAAAPAVAPWARTA
jgi:hypothetical protein